MFRNRQELIVPAELSEDFSSGTAGQGFTDESFMFPTTITRAADRMLVLINAQFDRGESGDPKLPFNITSVPAPEQIPATRLASAPRSRIEFVKVVTFGIWF